MIYKSNIDKKKADEENLIQIREDTELKEKEKEKNDKLALEYSGDKRKSIPPIKRVKIFSLYFRCLLINMINQLLIQ